MEKVKSVVLLSGGLDSAANLAFCHAWDEPVLAVTARYGQKAAEKEVESARELCRYYDVPHQVVDLEWLGEIGGSALTLKSQNVPSLEANQLDDRSVTENSARAVWVPNRNGVLIHVAAAFAERRGAARVLVGFNREEAATFPDNSEDYLHRVTAALALSTSTQVQAFSYTSAWNKREIVAELLKLSKPFPFEKIWSCYEGAAKPCGRCESCQRLARGLAR